MKPKPQHTNGDEGAEAEGGSGSESESEGSAGSAEAEAEELSLEDAEAPARALAALNALRKSRQHYDVVLVAGGAAGGVEVPAHRAVLAAASPYLLEALEAAPAAAPAPAPHAPTPPHTPPQPQPSPEPYRVEEVDGEALEALVEYAYTGRLRVRDAESARRLYLAAWRLRVEAARAHLAARLTRPRRLQPHAALAARALPGLRPEHLHHLDRYIANNFEEMCESGALATLPQIRIEVMREGGGGPGGGGGAGGEEPPLTVADAALAWLQDQAATDRDFGELCSRTHLVFVDARGALRDCGELPQAEGDAPELLEYRREARARRRPPAPAAAPHAPPHAPPPPRPLPSLQLGARAPAAECAVLAARRTTGGATTALLAVRGRLAAARAVWRAGAGGAGGGAGGALAGGARALRLRAGRCALGAAAVGGRLLVCGGYDRARVLREAELYAPGWGAWRAAPAMRRARARCPAARLRDRVYLLGGSDGHAELDSVEVYCAGAEGGAGAWEPAAPLPLAVSHAAAAADEARAALYVAGGWASGGYLRSVWRYCADDGPAARWTDEPPLATGRAQCAGAVWRGALWVVGGCDAWHCLASCERLPLGGAGGGAWEAGPALPTPRRSMGVCVWRGRLVACGGSHGAASLRATDWLEPHYDSPDDRGECPWVAGPRLRAARAGAGLAVLGDTLYAAGGFDGKEFLACAEYLSAPHAPWTTLCAPHPRRPSPTAAPHSPRSPQEVSDNRKPESDTSEAPESEASESNKSEEMRTSGETAAASE